ncbi:MAG: hypothetical protein PVJ57_04600 [Phycisphaerae bacterium]|jgi:hypothetical protein
MTTPRSLICTAVLAGLFCVMPASADVIVRLEPAHPVVVVGESVSVDIMATFDEPVTAWGLDLTNAEPTYAAWTATSIGDDWDKPLETLDGDGLAGLRFPSGISGDVLLATLTFEGLTEGETLLTLSSGPEEDEGILLASGSMADVQFTSATLTVVPEPATASLLLSALFLLPRRR